MEAAVAAGEQPLNRSIDAASRDVIAAAGHGDHYGHGLGHGIGLATHELPSLGRLAPEAPLPSPTVFSVEPGVYLDGQTGVRIEDLVVFDSGGAAAGTADGVPARGHGRRGVGGAGRAALARPHHQRHGVRGPNVPSIRTLTSSEKAPPAASPRCFASIRPKNAVLVQDNAPNRSSADEYLRFEKKRVDRRAWHGASGSHPSIRPTTCQPVAGLAAGRGSATRRMT